MARRPGVRQSDLDRATEATARFCALGMKPRRVFFGREGGFTLDFENQPAPANDLDAELAAFEARHGDD